MELKMKNLRDGGKPQKVAIKGQCVKPNTHTPCSGACPERSRRVPPVFKVSAFDSPFSTRYRCPHERSESHAPVRILAGPTHHHRPERPPPETHQHEERYLHVLSCHLLPLGTS